MHMTQRHAQFVHHSFAHHQAYVMYFAMVPETFMATICVLSGQVLAVHIIEIGKHKRMCQHDGHETTVHRVQKGT